LRDVGLEPDAGSQNPYLPGVPRDTPNRNYTFHLVPEGTDLAKFNYHNVVTFPAPNRGKRLKLSVYLRVYLPDQYDPQTSENLPNHLSGWVPLPRISAIDPTTNEIVECPHTRLYP